MKKVIEFIKDIRREMGKVTWHSRKQVTKLTVVVIVVSFTIGMFLQLLDIALQYILTQLT